MVGKETMVVTPGVLAPGPAAASATAADRIAALYAEHAGALYAFCLRYTADSHRAEDVVQEVFLRAWRSLPGLEERDGPVRPWLLAVARNLLTDLHRAGRRRPAPVGDAALDQLPAAETTEDVVARAAEARRVHAALGRLSAEHREVLVHLHWQGLSVGETAAALGIPSGTVKSRTFYALRALRQALDLEHDEA